MLGRHKNGGEDPMADPSSLGNLAVEMGYITHEELKSAVGVQQERLPLGQILMDMGKLTPPQLEELLFEQKVRRGEIRDKAILAQYERSRLRKKVGAIKEGFKEMRETTKSFSTSLLERARVK
jgi:hypothetical protein